MSTEANTLLYERAAEMVDYFEGKLPALIIEADLERGDLDALHKHVCNAESVAAQTELEASDIV